jgi:hypothetical protein
VHPTPLSRKGRDIKAMYTSLKGVMTFGREHSVMYYCVCAIAGLIQYKPNDLYAFLTKMEAY